MAKSAAILIIALVACASIAPALAAESVPIPRNVNCNRTCWNYPGLEGLKRTLFRLCRATPRVIEVKPGKYGCKTYIYYRFRTNRELVKFQNCQSVQKLFIDKVFNKGYKTPLKNPPKYARC